MNNFQAAKAIAAFMYAAFYILHKNKGNKKILYPYRIKDMEIYYTRILSNGYLFLKKINPLNIQLI